MELRQLRQFTVLAETLNFRAAAERLHIAQPPLSVSIRKLEEELGIALFDRSSRGVQLTDAGHAALVDARKALFHASEAARVARATKHGMAGRLRIGFVGSAKYAMLPQLLRPFRAAYGEVVLELSERSNGDIVSALSGNELDIGLIRVPFAQVNDIRYETVEEDVFVVALPEGHPLTAKDRIAVDDLIDEPFVHYSASGVPGLHVLSMMVLERAGGSPRYVQEAVQVDTVICLVCSGLGVALVPSVATRRPIAGVEFRPLDEVPSEVTIGLAIAYNPAHETASARRFRDLAMEVSGAQ